MLNFNKQKRFTKVQSMTYPLSPKSAHVFRSTKSIHLLCTLRVCLCYRVRPGRGNREVCLRTFLYINRLRNIHYIIRYKAEDECFISDNANGETPFFHRSSAIAHRYSHVFQLFSRYRFTNILSESEAKLIQHKILANIDFLFQKLKKLS